MGSLLRAGVVALLVLGLTSTVARANPQAVQQIKKHTKQAMEHFDMLEYELAKKLLLEAVVVAKKNKLTESKLLAETYLYLGVVYFAGMEDIESARLSFMDAVGVDHEIALDDAYRTDEMRSLLEEVRAEAEKPADPGVTDCDGLKGIVHSVLDVAVPGVDQSVSADVSGKLQATKISVHYRLDGATKFSEVKMTLVGKCTWQGTIPAKAVKGPWLHYYVAAHDRGGRVLAGSGSRQSPHLIEVETSDEVPDVLGGKTTGEITGPILLGTPTPKKRTVFLSVAVGSGGGYVSGFTEDSNADVGCCFAPALFHVFPEIGYYLSSQLSVSAAFRMGFPLDANRKNKSGGAPAGMLRLRYAISEMGDGLMLNGSAGYGVIRHTVKLTEVMDGNGDIDTSASGPLLLGTGAGYTKSLGGPMTFLAELNVIAGVPIQEKFQGVTDPSFAVQLDVNLGLLVAF